MAGLCASSTVPIMAYEALRGPEDAYDFAVRAAADVFSVKIAQSGGLFGAKRGQAIAAPAGIALYGGTMLEAGFGTSAPAPTFSPIFQIPLRPQRFVPLL